MTKFETIDNMNTNFVALSDQELMEMEGGGIDIAAPIKAVFNIGKEFGRALAKWF